MMGGAKTGGHHVCTHCASSARSTWRLAHLCARPDCPCRTVLERRGLDGEDVRDRERTLMQAV